MYKQIRIFIYVCSFQSEKPLTPRLPQITKTNPSLHKSKFSTKVKAHQEVNDICVLATPSTVIPPTLQSTRDPSSLNLIVS